MAGKHTTDFPHRRSIIQEVFERQGEAEPASNGPALADMEGYVAQDFATHASEQGRSFPFMGSQWLGSLRPNGEVSRWDGSSGDDLLLTVTENSQSVCP